MQQMTSDRLPMRSAFLFLALAAAMIGSSAKPADSTGGYQALGYGAESCGTYVQARRQRGFDEQAFGAWQEATCQRLDHTFAITGDTDFDDLLGWVDNSRIFSEPIE